MRLVGLRTALYLRRSKEEHQAASIEVQRGEGSAYIAREGGMLDPAHVFVDDNHGRAEFKKRPGLIAMLNAAERHDFDAVIVRDESRLGGDTNRTSLFIQDLLDADCRLFFYFTDEEVTIDGAVEKFMINVRNFASELEREKISQRTHEHLLTKALAERAQSTTLQTPQLEKEAAGLRVEIGRLVNAIASTDNPPAPLVSALSERQERLNALDARLRAVKAAPAAIELEVRRMEAEAKKRIADVRAALVRNPEEARKVLGVVLDGPLRVSPVDLPEGRRFQIEGAAAVGRLLAMDSENPNSASPAGFEAAAVHTDRGVSRTDRGVKPDATTAMQTPNLAMSGDAGDSQRNPASPKAAPAEPPASPRAAMLAALSAGMTSALATGDMDAVRVAHEAIGKLMALGLAAVNAGPVEGVVDLDAERRKRGR